MPLCIKWVVWLFTCLFVPRRVKVSENRLVCWCVMAVLFFSFFFFRLVTYGNIVHTRKFQQPFPATCSSASRSGWMNGTAGLWVGIAVNGPCMQARNWGIKTDWLHPFTTKRRKIVPLSLAGGWCFPAFSFQQRSIKVAQFQKAWIYQCPGRTLKVMAVPITCPLGLSIATLVPWTLNPERTNHQWI